MFRKFKIGFGICCSFPIIYGLSGVMIVKGYNSLSYEKQEKLPNICSNTVQFYEGNYRIARCLDTLGSIFIGYYIEKYSIKDFDNLSKEEREKKLHNFYEKGAKKALKTLEDLGGVFIKLGQELSLMKGIIPEEYTNAMSNLQDNVPSISYEEVRLVIKKSLGKDIEELFKEFDKEPVAAASLAQVHKAKLYDNTEVAVKIKYPRVTNFINIDLLMHTLFSEVYSRYEPKFHMNREARDDIQKHLRLELDFVNEANNALKCKECLKDIQDIYIPNIYKDYTSSDILTMEYIHGYKINDHNAIKQNKWNTSEIATIILSALADQIFVHGFVHADPHPGNVFIRKNPNDLNKVQVVLLDHGLYGELTDEFRIQFATFWKYVVRKDDKKLQEICDKLGIKHYDLFSSLILFQSYDGININVHEINDEAFKDNESEENKKKNPLVSLMEKTKENKDAWVEMMATLPVSIHLILRSMFITRALSVELGNPVNRFNIMARSAYNNAEDTIVTSSKGWNFEINLLFINIKSYVFTKIANVALKIKKVFV